MIIRKMGEVMRGDELDTDAKEEIKGYAEDYVDKLNVPSSERNELVSLIQEGMMGRFYVRNQRAAGEISEKTGKEYSLIAPSRRLGYETEAEAKNRNATQVRAAAVSRGKRFKPEKTVNEMSAEITPEVAQEEVKELAAEVTDTNLKQRLDRMVITYSQELSDDKQHSENRVTVDRYIEEIREAIEMDESYTQDEFQSISALLGKLKGKPYFDRHHRMQMEEIIGEMAKKLRFDDSKNASWQDSLKKSKLKDLIMRFEKDVLGDSDDLPIEFHKSENWQDILKADYFDFPNREELDKMIEEVEDTLMTFFLEGEMKAYMEQLNEDLQAVKRETDFKTAQDMFNALVPEIDKLYDEYMGMNLDRQMR